MKLNLIQILRKKRNKAKKNENILEERNERLKAKRRVDQKKKKKIQENRMIKNKNKRKKKSITITWITEHFKKLYKKKGVRKLGKTLRS